MSTLLIQSATLVDIGDAIREKLHTDIQYKPSEMPDAIRSIQGNSGFDGDFAFPYDCEYLFKQGRFYGSNLAKTNGEITEVDGCELGYLFGKPNRASYLGSDYNFWSSVHLHIIGREGDRSHPNPYPEMPFMFYGWVPQYGYPTITIDDAVKHKVSIKNMFEDAPDYDVTLTSNDKYMDTSRVHLPHLTETYDYKKNRVFAYMGLRKLPDCFYEAYAHNETCTDDYRYQSYSPWNGMLYGCTALEEALNIPVWSNCKVSFSRGVNNLLGGNTRLRRLTFETKPDGTPYEWLGLAGTIYINQCWGYDNKNGLGTEFNSNYFPTKFDTKLQITDDASYQELKDNPGRCPMSYDYSDYGHDSAVETINSLPIVTSATISIHPYMGRKTDQGAVNTLTDEEIAVATAKGWTVSLSTY